MNIRIIGKYLFSIVKKSCGNKAVIVFVCTCIVGGFPALKTLVNAELVQLISNGINMENKNWIWYEVCKLLLYGAIIQYLIYLATRVKETETVLMSSLLTDQIRNDMYQKARNVEYVNYDDTTFIGKVDNAKRELGFRPVSIISSLMDLLSSIVNILTYFFILIHFSLWIILPILICNIIRFYISKKEKKINYEFNAQTTTLRRKINYFSSFPLDRNIVREMKVYKMFDNIWKKCKKAFSGYYNGLKKVAHIELKYELGMDGLSLLLEMGILGWSVYSVLNGTIEFGQYILLSGSLIGISDSIKRFMDNISTTFGDCLYFTNLIDYLQWRENEAPILAQQDLKDNSLQTKIEFKDVSFSYLGSEQLVLDKVNFELCDGDNAVIIGENGTGKSTVVKLLSRLYIPLEGQILVNGIDIQNYSEDDYYDLVGVVFQDYSKYAMNVEENIVCCATTIDETKVDEVMQKVRVDQQVKNLPNGLKTELTKTFSKQGVDFSGGTWQKIAISRIFYAQKKIRIYDEPTASLDEESAKAVIHSIINNRKGINIVITHDMRFAKLFNRVIEL